MKVGNYNILAYHWYCNNPPFFGVVATEKMDGEWTARINLVSGLDEENDMENIAANGAKLNKKQALAFFPNLDAEKCLN